MLVTRYVLEIVSQEGFLSLVSPSVADPWIFGLFILFLETHRNIAVI
jgi:hypothetical protein